MALGISSRPDVPRSGGADAAAARAFETTGWNLKGAAFSSFFAALRPEHPRDRGLAERLERRQVSRGWHLKLIAFDTLFDFTPLWRGFFADLSRPWRPGALQAAAPSRQRVWQTKCVRSATLWRECVLDVRIVCHCVCLQQYNVTVIRDVGVPCTSAGE
jgi:hypothetical protein